MLSKINTRTGRKKKPRRKGTQIAFMVGEKLPPPTASVKPAGWV
jgi:hypothetical protein